MLRLRVPGAGNSRVLPPRPGAKPAGQPRRPAFTAPSFRPACPAPCARRVISRSRRRRQDVRDATRRRSSVRRSAGSPSPLAGREVSMGHPLPPPLPPPPPPPSAVSMARRRRRSASSVTQVDLAPAAGGGGGRAGWGSGEGVGTVDPGGCAMAPAGTGPAGHGAGWRAEEGEGS